MRPKNEQVSIAFRRAYLNPEMKKALINFRQELLILRYLKFFIPKGRPRIKQERKELNNARN